MNPICLSIKQEETGKRIKQLLQDHGYKVKDIRHLPAIFQYFFSGSDTRSPALPDTKDYFPEFL